MFCGPGRRLERESRGFVDLDVRGSVKTRGFVDLDVGWSVKTRGFVDPDVRWSSPRAVFEVPWHGRGMDLGLEARKYCK